MASKGGISVSDRKKRKLNESEDKGQKRGSGLQDEEVISGNESSSDGDSVVGDESDLDQGSSSSSGGEEEGEDGEEEGEDGEEDEYDFSKSKKSSKSKHDDGSESFSNALSNILGSHLKAYDRVNPILARNKRVLKKSEADKLELKAKKALLAQKKQMLNKTRNTEIIPTVAAGEDSERITKVLEKERNLRKIAQKGVVKLFNAILSTQVKTEREVQETLSTVKNAAERKTILTEVSKEKFLDLVKAAGNS
ncbi:rRNA-processing protein RRP15 Ecym_4406 [Eremothecium cymbalariae DBVPG|uniref:Rrp15p-domain-containing protein n=1 Tax=Eremothecium cymbalariae (strain CBS 270.75 / DBVPG 7215 / KCTC 17166 / NRRL Y-17582) TaxID=931890 RepID=G8JTV6_ERECY|nr:hypothetical protein Ecym_4406 [Eremothecium cymbalariae DBVPG\